MEQVQTPTREQINQKIQELIELLLPAYAGKFDRDPLINIRTHKDGSPFDNHQRVKIEIDVTTKPGR